MILLLLGPPGAGKGTQAEILAGRTGWPLFAAGAALREQVRLGTPAGNRARPLLDRGDLVPDELLLAAFEDHLAAHGRGDMLLDGIPRSLSQAAALDALLAGRGFAVDRALILDIPEEESIRRLLARASIEARSDDTIETIKHRLGEHRRRIEPLLNLYEPRGIVRKVDGTGSPEEVAERVREAAEVSRT